MGQPSSPSTPVTGTSSVQLTTNIVTLEWSAGEANANSSPDHYEVVIPNTSDRDNPHYSNSNVGDSTNPTSLNIPDTASLPAGNYTAEVRHCTAASNCSSPLNIPFTLTTITTTTLFQFTPSPLGLGENSNVWDVLPDVTSVYLDVEFSIGNRKDSASGAINVNQVDANGVVLTTHKVYMERDRGILQGVDSTSAIRIDVDNNAFDTSNALVTLKFYSGTNNAGDEIARATIQKETQPYPPSTGTASIVQSTGAVTLTWTPGAARVGANPDHYEVLIPNPGDPRTPLYDHTYINDAANPTTLSIVKATHTARTILGSGTHTAQVRHCNTARGCSAPRNIVFTINPEANVFEFTPRSLALGNSSNVWVVPATETAVYLNVDFTVGNAKDTNAGLINIHRLDSGGTVLSTHTVFDEYDLGVLGGVTGGSRLRIEADNDAFDVSRTLVVLTFHSGRTSAGNKIATATVQKQARPYAPANGSAEVNPDNGTIKLSWVPGPARLGAAPNHFRVAITPGSYTNDLVSDPRLTIYNGWSQGFAGYHLAEIRHCNAAGGCSEVLEIPFTQPPFKVFLLADDTSINAVHWGILDHPNLKLAGPPTQVDRNMFEFRIKAPSGTGLQANRNSCTWPTSAQPWPNEYSPWVQASQTIPAVLCGISDEVTELQTWVRHRPSGREFVTPAYSSIMRQSWHRADNQVTYGLADPLVPDIQLFQAELTIYTLSITSGKTAWNNTNSGITFTNLQNSATADVVVEGYVTSNRDTNDKCRGSVACTVNLDPDDTVNRNYPHLAGQKLYFERPPIWNTVQPDMTVLINEQIWTNLESLKNDSDYEYMPGIMAHEFGHTAGLGHSSIVTDVMWGGDELSLNDIEAMKSIYQHHQTHP